MKVQLRRKNMLIEFKCNSFSMGFFDGLAFVEPFQNNFNDFNGIYLVQFQDRDEKLNRFYETLQR